MICELFAPLPQFDRPKSFKSKPLKESLRVDIRRLNRDLSREALVLIRVPWGNLKIFFL